MLWETDGTDGTEGATEAAAGLPAEWPVAEWCPEVRSYAVALCDGGVWALVARLQPADFDCLQRLYRPTRGILTLTEACVCPHGGPVALIRLGLGSVRLILALRLDAELSALVATARLIIGESEQNALTLMLDRLELEQVQHTIARLRTAHG